MKIIVRVVGDKHSCDYCQARDGLEIKEDTDMPPFPEAIEEMPNEGCSSDLGCRCLGISI
jgi:hypothetical protein